MKKKRRIIDKPLEPSELILNDDGSVYHLKVRGENIADLVILVGDQNRVQRISSHFDIVEFRSENREFITHTGSFNDTRITAMSSGIGVDNIDIVINELDAAINIDPETRKLRSKLRKLQIVRIGTSGSLQEDIPVDSFVISDYGLGLDGLMNFYNGEFDSDEIELRSAFLKQVDWADNLNRPYFASADRDLKNKLSDSETIHGITATANGFYGPQGRQLVLESADLQMNNRLTGFLSKYGRITNYEMETSALYGLSSMLGHQACTVCTIIANRLSNSYSKDYKKSVDKLIEQTLHQLTS